MRVGWMSDLPWYCLESPLDHTVVPWFTMILSLMRVRWIILDHTVVACFIMILPWLMRVGWRHDLPWYCHEHQLGHTMVPWYLHESAGPIIYYDIAMRVSGPYSCTMIAMILPWESNWTNFLPWNWHESQWGHTAVVPWLPWYCHDRWESDGSVIYHGIAMSISWTILYCHDIAMRVSWTNDLPWHSHESQWAILWYHVYHDIAMSLSRTNDLPWYRMWESLDHIMASCLTMILPWEYQPGSSNNHQWGKARSRIPIMSYVCVGLTGNVMSKVTTRGPLFGVTQRWGPEIDPCIYNHHQKDHTCESKLELCAPDR